MARKRADPFNAGKDAYKAGKPLDPDYGAMCRGWGPISAQCLYEQGRLQAADMPRQKRRPKRLK